MFLLRRRYTVAVPSVEVRQHEVLQVSSLRPRASGVKPLRRMRKAARRVFRWAYRVAGQAVGMTAGQATGMTAGQAASMVAARSLPDCLAGCQRGGCRVAVRSPVW